MAYQIPTLDSIRAKIIASWRNLDPSITVDTDSDNYVRASGMASAILGLYQYFSYAQNQIFPDTMDWDNLVRFGAVRGLVPLPAIRAVGTARFTGTPNAVIPIGTILQIGALQYRTIQAGVITAQNIVDVAVVATDSGAASNLPADTLASLQSAPLGVSGARIQVMEGGIDAERQRDFLNRVLRKLALPPAGGNEHDFYVWATEVPGVSYAQVYPLRRGLGSVDVAVLFNGQPATNDQRRTVFDYIDARSPAGGENYVSTYDLIRVDVDALLTLAANTVVATVMAAAQRGLADYFASLKPGDSVTRSRLLLILSDIAGVTDVVINSPAASVVVLVDSTHLQLATLGNIVVSVQ